MNPRLRNAILFVHRWTGLTVGLLAVFAALTGLALVFRAQLQPLAERSLREVPACTTRLSLDEIVARASARLPGAKLLQLELFEGGYGASIVRFTDQEGVYVNSCTGAILGQKNRWAGFFGFAEWLHRYRFLGNSDVSEPLQGSVSLILAIVMVGGGLAIWWPSTIKALKNGLKLRWRLKGPAFDLNLHRLERGGRAPGALCQGERGRALVSLAGSAAPGRGRRPGDAAHPLRRHPRRAGAGLHRHQQLPARQAAARGRERRRKGARVRRREQAEDGGLAL